MSSYRVALFDTTTVDSPKASIPSALPSSKTELISVVHRPQLALGLNTFNKNFAKPFFSLLPPRRTKNSAICKANPRGVNWTGFTTLLILGNIISTNPTGGDKRG